MIHVEQFPGNVVSLTFYGTAQGMYKADLCRSAYLALHGGYYFDVDVLGKNVNASKLLYIDSHAIMTKTSYVSQSFVRT